MHIVIGGVLGWVAGTIVWLVTHHLVRRYESSHVEPGHVSWKALLGQTHGTAVSMAILLESGMVLWGGYLAWQFSGLTQVVSGLVVSGLLATISLVDWKVRRIPNSLVVALVLWAACQSLALGSPTVQVAVLGMVVGGGLFFLVALIGRGAMGAGDVKLAAALGALLGYPVILTGLLWGIVAAGAAAVWLLATRRAGRKDAMAYGPYLALGAWIAWTHSWVLWS